MSLSAFFRASQYGLEPDLEEQWNEVFQCVSFMFHGFIAFTLAYALRCHLKFRKMDQQVLLGGARAAPDHSHLYEDRSKLYKWYKKLRPAVDRWVFLFFLILLTFWVVTILLYVYVSHK